MRNHYADESEIFIVYGTPMGIGKSAYVNHVLADIHGYLHEKDKELLRWMWEKKTNLDVRVWEQDWEAVKKFVFYPPEEVVNSCLYMLDNDIVDVAFHWDDAGTWLYLMEFHDPFVIAFMEYLGLVRENWKGGVILSTPIKEWILKKIQAAEGVLQIKITKPSGTDSRRYPWKPRIASCYEKQKYPGSTRPYYPKRFTDRFVAIMPDDFFNDWYWPRRRKYGLAAATKMKVAILQRKRRGQTVAQAEEVLEKMGKHIADANEKAPELREAIVQKSSPAH